MSSSTSPHHCRALLLLLLAVTALRPSQGFLGLSFGQTKYWNLCAAELHCSCPEEALDAMTHGLECVGRSIASLDDNMVIPARFRIVDLSRNKLLQVSRSTFASNNTQVTHLDLSANELQDVADDTFANLPNLLSLNLKNNKISTISNTSLSSLSSLTSLDLSYNHLKFLPVELLWGSPQLESLSLAYNPIDQLQPGHLCRLSKLKRLDLTSLNLKTLHGDLFANTTSLEELVLVRNDILQVPTKALYRTGPSLRKLDLSGNYIETLVASSLYNLPHLEELRLEQMPVLRNIDAFAFYELTNLRTVVLRYLPKIRFIDEQAFSYTVNGSVVRSPVQDLTLSNTILQRMPEKLLDWQALKYVNLHNNRWNCDCQFSWIKGSALDTLVGTQFYCSYPTRVRGALLSMLSPADFVCRPSDKMPDAWQWGTLTLLLLAGIAVSVATVSVLFYRRNGYLFRPPSTYDKLIAQSRESMTVLDTTAIANTDTEINTATAT